MYTLENDHLIVKVHPRGAEIKSMYHKSSQTECMWQGDPLSWNRTAPILFPIVGRLKNDEYHYEGQTYSLNQHGFARDLAFELQASQDPDILILSTKSSEETKKVYPFDFQLICTYRIQDHTLSIHWEVINQSEGSMHFSLGFHPGFSTTMQAGDQMEDYDLHFTPASTQMLFVIEGGLIGKTGPSPIPVTGILPLSPKLFENDALVYKKFPAKSFSLLHRQRQNGITVHAADYPYLGIWSKKPGAFVCIEPWYGIADAVSHNQDLTQKEGIITLKQGQSKSFSLSIEYVPTSREKEN